MPGTLTETDANFFRLIHQLVTTAPGATERRQDQRIPFDSLQRIAPWVGGVFPAESDFITVRCHDLTQRGFSFFMPDEPPSKNLIVAFAGASDVIHVAAEVLRTDRVLLSPSGQIVPIPDSETQSGAARAAEEEGTRLTLVGCRFTRRVKRPAAR
jgi:hypothetical protein